MEDRTIVDSEMNKENIQEDPFKMPETKKTRGMSKGAAAGLGVGAAALAAAGVFVPFKLMGKDNDNSETTTETTTETGTEEQPTEATTAEEHDLVSETSVDNYTPTASDLPIASGVNDDMSFSEAFAAAREEVGAGGMFYWHGNGYGTYYENEWNDMSAEDKADYWASVSHSHSSYVEHHDNPIQTEFNIDDVVEWIPSDSYVVDANGNELPDVIVDVDGDGVGDVLLVDVQTNADGSVASYDDVVDSSIQISVDEDVPFELPEDDVIYEEEEYLPESEDYDLSADTSLELDADFDNCMDTTDLV